MQAEADVHLPQFFPLGLFQKPIRERDLVAAEALVLVPQFLEVGRLPPLFLLLPYRKLLLARLPQPVNFHTLRLK